MREVLSYTTKSQRKGEKKRTRGDYFERLIKFIPAEVVAFYIFLKSLVIHLNHDYIEMASWVILIVGIVGTILYLKNAAMVKNKLQISISTIAFVIWAFAIGGSPVTYLPGDEKDKAIIISLILTIYTFFIPLIAPKLMKKSS